jgi:hypothetical protein
MVGNRCPKIARSDRKMRWRLLRNIGDRCFADVYCGLHFNLLGKNLKNRYNQYVSFIQQPCFCCQDTYCMNAKNN